MQRVLDSSPVILDPVPRSPAPRRSLKRTASVASLPTPPRSARSKKRARKDISDEEKEELEDSSSAGESSTKPLARVLFKPKGVASKTKVPAKRTDEETAEDVFWDGPLLTKESPKAKKTKAPSTIGSAPVSPPHSSSKQVGPRFQTPPPLKDRPASRAVSSGGGPPLVVPEDEDGPLRDSPNNLFLVSSKAAHSPVPVADEAEEFEEPPTVSYVFRGKRQDFPNPLYNLPAEVHERSKLPLEHPDFSPSPSIKPKRLFSEELTKRTSKRRRTPSASPPSSIPTRPKRKATTIKKQRVVTPAAS
ncbi:hypothetical protein M408DRAFT_331936 [Serendipita vermifera MAFF 305830]|uniref:Uncharacterized protein n=1 Tax=Serendipita vermifera MAFF 305830 TaxID=933852 RepID=A0A0C2X4A4_SERVB|nr:hypothetical protein M408DRAFT_331936 [Serendipita vermifera MAFF 305830]